MVARSVLSLLLGLYLPGAAHCFMIRSNPVRLFYQPPGTYSEVYSRNPALQMTVYPYGGDRPKRGAVIFIHGGGWQVGGSLLPFYQDWEGPLADLGLQAFSIEHRLAPRFRGVALVSDCIAAVRYVRENAARFGVPEDRLALVGFSSGGQLAVMTGLALGKERVRAVAAFYAPLDLEMLLLGGNGRIQNYIRSYVGGGDVGAVSPVVNLHGGTPVLMVVHGERDLLVPYVSSLAFVERARELGVDMISEVVPGAGHNFVESRSYWAREVEGRVLGFIEGALEDDGD